MKQQMDLYSQLTTLGGTICAGVHEYLEAGDSDKLMLMEKLIEACAEMKEAEQWFAVECITFTAGSILGKFDESMELINLLEDLADKFLSEDRVDALKEKMNELYDGSTAEVQQPKEEDVNFLNNCLSLNM